MEKEKGYIPEEVEKRVEGTEVEITTEGEIKGGPEVKEIHVEEQNPQALAEELERPESGKGGSRKKLLAVGLAIGLGLGIAVRECGEYFGGGKGPQIDGAKIAEMVRQEMGKQKQLEEAKRQAELKQAEFARKIQAEKASKEPEMKVLQEKKETPEIVLRKMEDAARYVATMAEKVARESFLWHYWGNGKIKRDKNGQMIPNPEYKQETWDRVFKAYEKSLETALSYGYRVLNDPKADEKQREEVGSLIKVLVEGDGVYKDCGHGLLVTTGRLSNNVEQTYKYLNEALKQGKGSVKFGENIKNANGEDLGRLITFGDYSYLTEPTPYYYGFFNGRKGELSPIDALRQWTDAHGKTPERK